MPGTVQWGAMVGTIADQLDLVGVAGLITAQIVDLLHPVGSVWIGVTETSPATLFGHGTWVAIGAGRVLVGQDTDDPDFDVLEETGGTKMHTLTAAEMPSHTHTYTAPDAPAAAGLIGIFPLVTGVTAGIATGSTGGGGAHNNLPPFLVVKMWRRIG